MLSTNSKISRVNTPFAPNTPALPSPDRAGLWALVDCNNFYASCERLFRPDLAQRPVVVLSNNDGCIVARSQEAKALGIPMGSPEFKVRHLLREHKVAVFSSNYALYGDISHRIMRILESVAAPSHPKQHSAEQYSVEQYSIDEAFVHLSPALAAQATEWAENIRDQIRQWTGITVSIGLGPTRTLAKLCSEVAKQGHGVFRYSHAPHEQVALLQSQPVREVWGIGRKQALKLRLANVHTAHALAQCDDAWLRKNLSVCGWRTAMELRGLPCIGEENAPVTRKSLVCSRSFGQRVTEKAALQQALSTFTATAAARLRREALHARGMAVCLRTSHYRNPENKNPELEHDVSAQSLLVVPTANTSVLIRTAHALLESLYKPGFAFVKAGITLFELEEKDRSQGNLLSLLPTNPAHPENPELMAALDAINYRYGKQTLRYAAEGPKKAPWHLRQAHCSPTTTTWSTLAVAYCK